MTNPIPQHNVGDVVVHKDPYLEQKVVRVFTDGGVAVESGDFYRDEVLSFVGNFSQKISDSEINEFSKWKASCGNDCCIKQKHNQRNNF